MFIYYIYIVYYPFIDLQSCMKKIESSEDLSNYKGFISLILIELYIILFEYIYIFLLLVQYFFKKNIHIHKFIKIIIFYLYNFFFLY